MAFFYEQGMVTSILKVLKLGFDDPFKMLGSSTRASEASCNMQRASYYIRLGGKKLSTDLYNEVLTSHQDLARKLRSGFSQIIKFSQEGKIMVHKDETLDGKQYHVIHRDGGPGDNARIVTLDVALEMALSKDQVLDPESLTK